MNELTPQQMLDATTVRRLAVRLTCCGRDDGIRPFMTWAEADAFREAYLSGPGVGLPTETRFGGGGHSRSAIIVDGDVVSRPGGTTGKGGRNYQLELGGR